MSQPRDNALDPQGQTSEPAPAPVPHQDREPRRPWERPEIRSSRIFHGVVLAGFNPTFCGAGS